MHQVVKSNLFLYAENSGLIYQHRYAKENEKQLNKDFKDICDWFLNSKLSIHFVESKAKSILFASKWKIKSLLKTTFKI